MRILVAGAGMAGTTLAGKLRAHGITTVALDRVPEYGRRSVRE